MRLEVPSADIAMPVVPVGVAEDGTMALPPDAAEAGWYRFGPAPGTTTGTTLVAAHVDSRRSGIGPFSRLRDLARGDAVRVTTADGVTHDYVVVDVEKVPKEQAPVASWFDRDGARRLVLVTCGGEWRADTGHYADNVAATAEPAGG